MNARLWWLLLLCFPFVFPAGYRLWQSGLGEPAGLASDFGLGLVFFVLAALGPRLLRVGVLVVWGFFQGLAIELFSAVGRFPSWQDLQYLVDPHFLATSAGGLHLAHPVYLACLAIVTGLACWVPRPRLGRLLLVPVVGSGLALVLQMVCLPGAGQGGQGMAERYNPLHWFMIDAVDRYQVAQLADASPGDIPASLRLTDLDGASLLGAARGKNVLIIAMEGIPGIYHPEIREEMGVAAGPYQMEKLAAATPDAMLVPDFVTHSHQTIRGLYALHCGDFSKFSFETPKGMELQLNTERAAQCLPARLAAGGWTTHYLQGAPLQFMGKDRVMPAMGFEEVHGFEWFDGRTREEFTWGATDTDFFAGATEYIDGLQKEDKPWLLSLLTVGTHQPFDAPEELVEKYGSRKIAAVAKLDGAVADFLDELRSRGVLDSTLVLITSDESHGAGGADWYSGWGTMMVVAPHGETLPRIKRGTYGLVDVTASVLDYLGQPMGAELIGRSLFRDYDHLRDMLSYTAGKLRWQTADNQLYECSADGNCTLAVPGRILAPNPSAAVPTGDDVGRRIRGIAAFFDHKLTVGQDEQRLQFAHGEVRKLPVKVRSEWADNLVGAQYLHFPKDSKVEVDIRIKALTSGEEGIRLSLVLRQFEQKVDNIDYPSCPLLQPGEECTVQFRFSNSEERKAFSFHLVGEGTDSTVKLEKFEVAIMKKKSGGSER